MFAVFDLSSIAGMLRHREPLLTQRDAAIERAPCVNAEELAAGLQAIGGTAPPAATAFFPGRRNHPILPV